METLMLREKKSNEKYRMGDNLSVDRGNKNRHSDGKSERCHTMDNNQGYTKVINKSVNSQPAKEGYQGGEGIPGGVGIPELDKGRVGIPEVNKGGGGIPEVDKCGGGIPEGDKGRGGIPEGDKGGVGIPEIDKDGGGIPDFDKKKQSEAMGQKSDKDALIQNKDLHDNGSKIKLKENPQDCVHEWQENGQSGLKMEDVIESEGTANGNKVPSMEKEVASAVLRQGQTYDEEEDFEEDAFDVEKCNKVEEKFVYFWKNIYSTLYMSYFSVHGNDFCCAEQYMMFKKAELFEDKEIANQILKCKDPKKIKAFGRKVRGFNQEIWQQHCLYIVKEGNREKFLQNKDYLADLLFTYPKVLVEASPYDTIWGIGLTENSPEAWDKSTWKGSNYLGFVITEVRDDIMVERGMIEERDREVKC